MRLIQYRRQDGTRAVAVVGEDGDSASLVPGVESTYTLALTAIELRKSLRDAIVGFGDGETINYAAAIESDRVLTPIDHPDPSHCLVTGTGLSHLGSADARDQMHAKLESAGAEELTDSMRMFQMGLEGGKPGPGATGVQPEWFYKGDGTIVAAPEKELAMPAFALDGGEEPEIAGVYVIGSDGRPYRVGFVLGNEFSDHVMEQQNYLYLAHSKLRQCSIGPELMVGTLPSDVRGVSRLIRGDKTIWEKQFLSGEDNMSHAISNLEHHHFKYGLFRQQGDLHIHFFGTATLSFADGVKTEPGDIFEIQVAVFGRPLRNRLVQAEEEAVTVRQL